MLPDPIDRRTFLAALPALAMSSRVLAQSPVPGRFRVNGLSQITLTVSDLARSLDFYQGLFGTPIQARHGSTSVLLRIGSGPRFIALRQASAGQAPSISALGFGVHDFSIDAATQTLSAHGFTAAPSDAPKPGPKQWLVRARRQSEGGSPDGTRDLFAADPSGIVFQLHDTTYCGGSGPLGNVCTAVEPSPKKGIIALRDTSHFTLSASDPTTVPTYLELFGFTPMVYQAQTPAWRVGNGVHFLMFIGGGGPTRANTGSAPAPARGGAAPGAGPAPGRGRGTGAPGTGRAGGIDHACVAIDNFDAAAITKLLVGYGLKQQEGQGRNPLVTYISLRMPNRGGAEGGTPELYFTDPDGLAIQIQDVKYCGGGGLLGELCPTLPSA